MVIQFNYDTIYQSIAVVQKIKAEEATPDAPVHSSNGAVFMRSSVYEARPSERTMAGGLDHVTIITPVLLPDTVQNIHPAINAYAVILVLPSQHPHGPSRTRGVWVEEAGKEHCWVRL